MLSDDKLGCAIIGGIATLALGALGVILLILTSFDWTH